MDYGHELSQALHTLGSLLVTLERADEALPHLLAAIDVYGRLGDEENEAKVRGRVAALLERDATTRADAEAQWRRVRESSHARGDAPTELEAVRGLVRIARAAGADPERVKELASDAEALARSLNDLEALGDALNTRGIVEFERGEHGEALARYEEALDVFRELEDRAHEGLMLASCGVTLHRLGRLDDAEGRLEAALALAQASEQPVLEARALAALGDVEAERGQLVGARRCYERSLEVRRAHGDRRGEGWMLHDMARIRIRQGALGEARARASEARTAARETGDPRLGEACDRLARDLASTDQGG
jgi:tetratricopeptide (TPR) repeat protein